MTCDEFKSRTERGLLILDGATGSNLRLAGMPLRDCMRRASKASSISVTRLGAADSIPRLSEVE